MMEYKYIYSSNVHKYNLKLLVIWVFRFYATSYLHSTTIEGKFTFYSTTFDNLSY